MRRRVPTVEEFIPRAMVGLAPRSRELYAFYLRPLAERHGRRKIDQLASSDITELGVWAQAMAVRRSTSVSGASAREHAIAARRRLFVKGQDEIAAWRARSRHAKPLGMTKIICRGQPLPGPPGPAGWIMVG